MKIHAHSLHYERDHPSQFDGGQQVIWEPLWQLRTGLYPVEVELLACPAVRRLHFVHHAGIVYVASHSTFSRLQHTLGVFSLVAHFYPDNQLLRVAALLHDIGHPPFSHSLEPIIGINHHQQTCHLLLMPPVSHILDKYDIDPKVVLAYIQGQPTSILRNQTGDLHADHLDSWVRSASVRGILPLRPRDILDQLFVQAAYLATSMDIADVLVDLIVAEAEFHCSNMNIGTNSLLRHLVEKALEAKVIHPNQLVIMTDCMVKHRLLESSLTADDASLLWYQPNQIRVWRDAREVIPEATAIVDVDRLYLSMPRVNGVPVTLLSPRSVALLAEVQQLKGRYAVSWS